MGEPSRITYTRDPMTVCFVPNCGNRVINWPHKHFFRVPQKNKPEWCNAVGKPNIPKSALYICEDHLNLQEDLLNYKEFEEKGKFGKLRPDVPMLRNIPTCQASGAHLTIQEEARSSIYQMDKSIMCIPEICHKSIQAKPTTVDRQVATIRARKPITYNLPKPLRCILEEDFRGTQSPSVSGSTTEYSETETSVSNIITPEKVGRNFILKLIKNTPISYLGLPKQFYWLINYIEDKNAISALHTIITIYKIKNNETFQKISDLFEIFTVTLWRLYPKTLFVLHAFFKQFIYWLTASTIKSNLPMVFRSNALYANMQIIIDCFEIEIEKPKDPIQQALTWSQYKSCNTIKYLIGSTPDGFINFISEGYGGRITDMTLVEQSGFLESVPENCTVLADRGFKHLESELVRKNVKILRPPSVLKDTKLSKEEVMESKVIASLRVHIERVIRRVRLYRMLKPHSTVNNKLVNLLDMAVVVACGLINIQSPVVQNC